MYIILDFFIWAFCNLRNETQDLNLNHVRDLEEFKKDLTEIKSELCFLKKNEKERETRFNETIDNKGISNLDPNLNEESNFLCFNKIKI